MENFLPSLEIVLPLFLIILLGYFLKQRKVLPASFADDASRLLFYVVLPILFIEDLWSADLSEGYSASLLIVLVLGMTIVVALTWVSSRLLRLDPLSTPSFISGAFRSNIVYVGYALLRQVYDELPAEISFSFLIILVILNLYASVIYSGKSKGKSFGQQAGMMLKGVLTNPLNVGLIIGFLLNVAQIPEPKLISNTFTMLSRMASPLALLSIGVAFNLQGLKRYFALASQASLIKLVISPLIGLGLALLFKLPASSLLLVWMVFGTPTALNTFSMDRELGGNSELVAAIILVTTMFSMISLTLVVFIFMQLGLI